MSLTIPTDCVPGVIADLTALMLAGEASPSTRRFLEAHASENPAFAACMDQAAQLRLSAPPPPPPAAGDDGLETLKLVRQYTIQRTIYTAMGIAFTVIPLAFTFDESGFQFLLLGKQPGIVYPFWALAAASWVAFWTMHRQIRKRGI